MKAANINEDYLISERKRIGLALKAKREAKGLTTQQLADELGISRSTITKVELGYWNCGIDTISSIGVMLDFKIEI
jgi:transcriptional regulator with XRE-family HTH domain